MAQNQTSLTTNRGRGGLLPVRGCRMLAAVGAALVALTATGVGGIGIASGQEKPKEKSSEKATEKPNQNAAGLLHAKASGGPLTVVVSIPPLKGLVEPLLPMGSKVEVLIPPGVSEHGYEIPPTKLAAITGADLVVFVGLGMEPQVERLVRDHPKSERRDFSVADAVGVEAEAHDHDHHGHNHAPGEACEHGVDPHIWLDPHMVKTLVMKLDAELTGVEYRADGSTALSAQARELVARIDRVHEDYTKVVAGASRKSFVVGHDAWGRLAGRYGLETIPIAGLTASEPTPSAIAAATAAAKDKGVTTVFVEPQLSQRVAKRIATTAKMKLDVLDPLGSGDWEAMMRSNLVKIGEALGSTVKVEGK